MSRITHRRLTTKSNKSGIEDDDGDIFDESMNKNITFDQEDTLMSIILKHFDVIETMDTEVSSADAWKEIAEEFNRKTRVSCTAIKDLVVIHFDIFVQKHLFAKEKQKKTVHVFEYRMANMQRKLTFNLF